MTKEEFKELEAVIKKNQDRVDAYNKFKYNIEKIDNLKDKIESWNKDRNSSFEVINIDGPREKYSNILLSGDGYTIYKNKEFVDELKKLCLKYLDIEKEEIEKEIEKL